ncbi:glycosyltransferase [Chitinophaga solisilvae]|uniref:glycosyltransferase n=1 Tax=Chitinophaga solisilvae TaxID=1233460 RepID=UPI001368DF4C|nr:glycosyltransferase [Chitinophaga solisilvae]
MIPKVIHLTYAGGKLPPLYRQCIRRAKKLHAAWQFKIYDDAAARQVLEQQMPVLLPVYDGYPTAIQRADMFRVVVVYLFGGFYLDMDMYCHTPLDELCHFQLVLAEEKVLSEEECGALGHLHRSRIANYMFGSMPQHPFWPTLLNAMIARYRTAVSSERDILETTGPGLLTDIYHQSAALKEQIWLLRNPGTPCINECCGGLSCHFGTYASHYHGGSWRWQHQQQHRAAGVPAVVDTAAAAAVLEEHLQRNLDRFRRQSGALYVLEAYTSGEGHYDGLTTIYNRVKNLGEVLPDTHNVSDQKILVCGIPFLYEKQLSAANTNILFTTFESDRLPAYWIESINRHYHHCIVPHEAIAGVFRKSGVRVPLQVMHQGFTRYTPMPAQQHTFNIGFMGVPVRRKNLSRLYKACKMLQRKKIPGIQLHVHVSVMYEWVDDLEFDRMRADPMVRWTTGKYDHQEMSAWYANLSCYVFPSSGEGWSFTPRESMFLGIPTIISPIPVHQELLDSGFCYAMRRRGSEKAAFGVERHGKWACIREKDIAAAITQVHKNYDACSAAARRGADWISGQWKNEELQEDLRLLVSSLV